MAPAWQCEFSGTRLLLGTSQWHQRDSASFQETGYCWERNHGASVAVRVFRNQVIVGNVTMAPAWQCEYSGTKLLWADTL